MLRPTAAQLVRLRNVARWAEDALADPVTGEQQVADQLRKAVVRDAPDIVRIADSLLGPRGVGVAAWISIILALVGIFLSTQQDSISLDDVTRLIHEVNQDNDGSQPTDRSTPTPTPLPPQREERGETETK
ncbi:hypothetical protein [Leifsonia sp. Le1]|uniref:hypothetical protein n=1 Tax=Leifsonia sp. Le1 TaxID=3404918 RepID=UPI003EBDC5BB